MWSKLDDDLLHHDKTEEAARRFGRKRGLVTALGTVAFGLLYANWKLTDGFIPDQVLERYGIDAEQREVMAGVRFWHRDDARGGYVVHDFHELNPTAAAVKAKRLKDRLRKQSRYGFVADSSKDSTADSALDSTVPRAGFHGDSQSGDPRPAPPVPTTPQPPALRGARQTRATRQAALRAHGPVTGWRGGEGCPHTPRCGMPTDCLLRTAREGGAS